MLSGQTVYELDQRINERGFGIDAKLAAACVKFLQLAKNQADAEMARATDGVVTAPTQRDRLLGYLQRKYQLDLPNMRASEIRAMLEADDLNPEVRWLLEARLAGAKSSGSKYGRGLQMMGEGERIRHALQMNGAGRTGRWSGKGFQPHNMGRPQLNIRDLDGRMRLVPIKAKYIDEVIIPGIYSHEALRCPEVYGAPNEAAMLALRHCIVAAPGNELLVADWSNIESRVLAWIADEEWKLGAYRAVDAGTGVDLYKQLWHSFFGIPIEAIDDVMRQGGKVSELAFGYHGAVGALVTMAASYQMDLEPLAKLILPRATPEQLHKASKAWRRAFLLGEDYELSPGVFKACDVLKQSYRASNARIDQLARDVDNCIKDAIREPGRSFQIARCQVIATLPFLILELPSGRRLLYAQPKLEQELDEDPESKQPIRREFVTYSTARGKGWRRERAWSGLWLENIDQAISNDILRAALVRIDRATREACGSYIETLRYDQRTAISLHVHDEIVLDLPVGAYELRDMMSLMVAPEPWMRGLPLSCEGWRGPRYGKRSGKSLRELAC